MIVAGTGHRPDKLGGYDPVTFQRLVDVATRWLEANRPSVVLSGMALGWDQALAKAAINLSIPVHAYVPFIGQADKWSKDQCEGYCTLLQGCTKIVNVTFDGYSKEAFQLRNVTFDGYSKEAFQLRNEAMVDSSDLMLALWDGSPGGTANCLRYAGEEGRPVVNLWEEFMMEDI